MNSLSETITLCEPALQGYEYSTTTVGQTVEFNGQAYRCTGVWEGDETRDLYTKYERVDES